MRAPNPAFDDALAARREHLNRAWIALDRAADCRIGYLGESFISDAADHLTAAGRPALAAAAESMICNGGGHIAKLQDAIDAELKADDSRRIAALRAREAQL